MIEKVARAMCVADGVDPDNESADPSDEGARLWTTYAKLARAAIEAMREPTPAMIEAGNYAIDEHIDSWNYDSSAGYSVGSTAAVASLNAMIDEALK